MDNDEKDLVQQILDHAQYYLEAEEEKNDCVLSHPLQRFRDSQDCFRSAVKQYYETYLGEI